MKLFRKMIWISVAVSISSSAVYAFPNDIFFGKYAAIVIDANSGKTLFEEKANMRRYPASLTKMMTLYMLFDAMQSGRISRNTSIPISVYAASRPPTKMGLSAGQRIRAEAAAKALITRSANDVAVAIGEYLGRSEKNFAKMMNLKARQLGMTNSNFTNASGLPDPKNYSTARDMAILSLALRKHFPQQYELFSITSFIFRGRNVKGHNTLVKSMKGVDGIKTGYTHMSGFNLASSRRSGEKSIVAVVMGAKTAVSRDAYMADLLARYMEKASNKRASPLLSAMSRVNLPEGMDVPIPVTKDFFYRSNEIILVQIANNEITQNFERNNIPIPVAKDSVRIPFVSKDDSNMSDREYDSFLLTVLASQNFSLSAAVISANQPVIKNPPVPIRKVGDNTELLFKPSGNDRKGGWTIQIASLPSQTEANEILRKTSRTIQTTFTEAEPYTQFFKKDTLHHYRVRFGGFTSLQAAKNACSELEKMNLDCYTIKNNELLQRDR